MSKNNFQAELRALLNKHSRENGSNTPDFVLASYLIECLVAFDRAVGMRVSWYGGEDMEEQLLAGERSPNLPKPEEVKDE